MTGMYIVLRVKVDGQFPLPPNPNYSYIRARRQRKLRINLGHKI